MNQKTMTFLLFGSFLFLTANSRASSDVSLAEVDFDHSVENIKSGAQVAMDVCRLCHEFKYIKYRNLLEIGFNKDEVDVLRGDMPLNTSILSTTKPEIASKLFGMMPPDLSLMAKARRGGARYIYTLLTSYSMDAEEHVDNKLFPGIKMPDPFAYAIRTDDVRQKELDQRIENVSVFLQWTSDPKAKERRRTGYYVIAYLIVLTFLFYLLKRKVWRTLK
ncbi:MAG: cytochrome C [Gammaproteobacteria bacterium]|nr:cytochrome C [Gammaproteobacteria bacterium]